MTCRQVRIFRNNLLLPHLTLKMEASGATLKDGTYPPKLYDVKFQKIAIFTAVRTLNFLFIK
jgi:hypothetical protein